MSKLLHDHRAAFPSPRPFKVVEVELNDRAGAIVEAIEWDEPDPQARDRIREGLREQQLPEGWAVARSDQDATWEVRSDTGEIMGEGMTREAALIDALGEDMDRLYVDSVPMPVTPEPLA